jgi:hypothetical protein
MPVLLSRPRKQISAVVSLKVRHADNAQRFQWQHIASCFTHEPEQCPGTGVEKHRLVVRYQVRVQPVVAITGRAGTKAKANVSTLLQVD